MHEQYPMPFSKLLELRREFDRGEAGKASFRAVAHGEPCGARVGEKVKKCGQPSTGTVGFDVPGGYDFVGCCGPEHRDIIERRIEGESLNPGLNPSGHAPSLDFNGNGRR